jgi:hypothetical protein
MRMSREGGAERRFIACAYCRFTFSLADPPLLKLEYSFSLFEQRQRLAKLVAKRDGKPPGDDYDTTTTMRTLRATNDPSWIGPRRVDPREVAKAFGATLRAARWRLRVLESNPLLPVASGSLGRLKTVP